MLITCLKAIHETSSCLGNLQCFRENINCQIGFVRENFMLQLGMIFRKQLIISKSKYVGRFNSFVGVS